MFRSQSKPNPFLPRFCAQPQCMDDCDVAFGSVASGHCRLKFRNVLTTVVASVDHPQALQSSTPPGSPPRLHQQPQQEQQHQNSVSAAHQPPPVPVVAPQQNAPSPDVASMLQAIAEMAKHSQNSTSTPAPPPAAPEPLPPTTQTPQFNIGNPQGNGTNSPAPNPSLAVSQPQNIMVPAASVPLPYPSTTPNTNGNHAFPAFPNQLAGFPMFQVPQNQPPAQTPFPQFNTPAPQQMPSQMGMDQLALLQILLQQQNAAQLAPALQALLGAAGQSMQMQNPVDPNQLNQNMWGQPGMQQQQQQQQSQVPTDGTRMSDGYAHEQRRERGYSPPPRSPPRYGGGARRGRSRSRSPVRFGSRDEGRSPPSFRRRSPVYGEYEGNSDAGRNGSVGRDSERGRGGRNRGRKGSSPRRRDRSPGRQGTQGSPAPRDVVLPKVPKNVTFASDIASNSVRGKIADFCHLDRMKLTCNSA
jgi:protein NRD1